MRHCFLRKDSISYSNFKIDLPQTLKLPDNCVFYIDDVSIPYAWHTVRANTNDKLYFRINGGTANAPNTDYIITLDSKTYSGTQFTAEVQSKITFATAGTATTGTYDTQSKRMSISVASFDITFLTDDELKTLSFPSTSAFHGIDVNNLASGNELLTNIFQASPVGNTANPAEFYLMLTPVRNIYLKSPNLSSFNTIGCNGEASIIKKIPVNVAPGDMITSYITSATDYLDCSRATWKTIEIMVQDVHGNEINLHGSNWSFSILFDIANPNI